MRAVKLAVLFCTAGLLAGCSDYFDHNDHLSPYSGEAMAANRVAQMVDPWPAASASPKYGANGERMQRAMSRYKSGESSASSTSSSSSSSSSSGSASGSTN